MACDKCGGLEYFIETDPQFNPESQVKTYCACDNHNFTKREDLPEDFKLYNCPDCGFSFSAEHQDDTEKGGYTCPPCEADALRAAKEVSHDTDDQTSTA